MPRSARRTYILRLAAVVSLHRCLSPFGKAIIVATALHCVLMAHRWSRFPHSTRSLRPTNGKSTELQIELEGPNLDGYGPASRRLTTADSTAFAQRDLPRKAAVVTGFSAPQAPTSHRIESTEPPHAGLESAPSLAESIPEASLPMSAPTTGPQPKIDLGLNGGLLRMLEAQAGVNPTPKPAMPNRARDSALPALGLGSPQLGPRACARGRRSAPNQSWAGAQLWVRTWGAKLRESILPGKAHSPGRHGAAPSTRFDGSSGLEEPRSQSQPPLSAANHAERRLSSLQWSNDDSPGRTHLGWDPRVRFAIPSICRWLA